VRAEVVASTLGINSLYLPSSAIRDYFYFFTRRPGEDRSATLYELLRAAPTAAFADLRLCYRIRRLELSAAGLAQELGAIERAFNLLMHPELRSCYDALLRDADSPALFPYRGRRPVCCIGRAGRRRPDLFRSASARQSPGSDTAKFSSAPAPSRLL
jgi:hypothetical protein